MGHAKPTDLALVLELASSVWRLLESDVFPGNEEFLRDLPDDLVPTARSFRVAVRLQRDEVGVNLDVARTMVALRFTPTGERSGLVWTLHVRGDWPQRTDRLPTSGLARASRVRRLMAPKRRTGSPEEYALHDDDIFLMATAPRADLTAQIILFLLQTELSAEAELLEWLEGYFRRHFKAAGTDPAEMAREIALHALKHKWYMEDARAWRRYIAHTRRGLRRKLLRQRGSDIDVNHVHGGRGEEQRLIAGLDGEETASAGPPPPHTRWDPTGEFFTIDEAARLIQRSRRTTYDRTQRELIATQMKRGRRVIAAEEVKRLQGSLPRAVAIKLLAQRRATSGRDKVAATRKWVYRREKAGDSLEDILSGFLGRRVRVV